MKQERLTKFSPQVRLCKSLFGLLLIPRVWLFSAIWPPNML
jgi:hypothetical protein